MSAEHSSSITPEDFHSIISSSMDGFLLVDMAGSILEANESYCNLMGYQRDQLISMHVSSVDAIDSQEVVVKRVAAIQKAGSLRFETSHRHKDGTIIDVEVSANYSPSYGGMIFSFLRNITERKQMEADLSKLAEFNRRIINSIDSNMAVVDSNGLIQGTNKAWELFAKENLGVDESRWGVGANYFVEYDAKWGDAELAQEAFEGVRNVQSGELTDFSLEYPCHGPGDVKRWFLLKVLPLLGENGSVLVSHADITTQKLTEDALKESEWKFQALFENGPIGVAYHRMIYDDSGKAVDYYFLDANDKYIELTGVDPRGKTVLQAFPGIENDPFDWIGVFGHVARTGETIHIEQYLQLNDRWYNVVGYQYKPDHFVAAFFEITRRKRAEVALKNSTEKFQGLVKNVPGHIAFVNASTLQYDFVNDAYEKSFGIASENIIGHHVQEIIGEANFHYAEKYIDEVLAGKSVSYENSFDLISGKRWHEVTYNPIYDADGQVTSIVVLSYDITERKRAEEALKTANLMLQESEQRYRTVADFTSDWEFWITPEGEFRYISPSCEQITGYTAEEFYADPQLRIRIIHPEDRACYDGHIHKISSYGTPTPIDFRIFTKHGECRWISHVCRTVYDDAGTSLGQRASNRDVTDRKRTEEQLKKNQRLLALSQKIGKVGGWEFNTDTGKLTWTDEVYNIHEVDSSFEPTVDEGINFYAPASRPIIEQAVQRAIEYGEPFDVELEIITAKGNHRFVHSIGNAEQENHIVYGFFQDITERKEVEDKISKLNDELEIRVKKRTADLERMNRELEDFCYSLSHEFRAPIARLQGFSDIMKELIDRSDKEGLAHCADRIEVASIRLRTVIDGLLRLNRLSRANIDQKPVNLSEMSQQILAEIIENIGDRNVKITVAPDIEVQGDRYMLEICMRNLLANAVKYTSKTAEATVEFGKLYKDGVETYYVRDNGVGFDMCHTKNLFVSFCRLHTEKEFEGTGLGLATVKRIIEKHNGLIWAEAAEGEGATFYFTLNA